MPLGADSLAVLESRLNPAHIRLTLALSTNKAVSTRLPGNKQARNMTVIDLPPFQNQKQKAGDFKISNNGFRFPPYLTQ